MICPHCQKEVADKFRFCPECGFSISGLSEIEDGQNPAYLKTFAGPKSDDDADDVPTLVRPGSEDKGAYGQAREGSGTPGSATPPGGKLTDSYELLDEVGRGGFAVVWRARDRNLNRQVAVKRLLPEVVRGAGGKQVLERFRKEALSIAALNHVNIVPVYLQGEDNDGPYVVMELVAGGTLKSYVKEQGGKLPLKQALELIKGVAQGLDHAHRKGLIHRDIKPGNILIHRDGEKLTPKIGDFGLARMGGEIGATMEPTMEGYGMGTQNYMPPEQEQDARNANQTADIYALGKVLYEILSGEIPNNIDPDKLPRPKALAAIINKCVKYHPNERYFSTKELLDDLDRMKAPASGSASSITRSAESAGACSNCDHENSEKAVYCEGCGQGLFRKCPECSKENRLNVQFCSACGTDTEAFLKASESLDRMERMAAEHKHSRVAKEFALLAADMRLRGDKGAALVQKIKALNEKSATVIKKLSDLDSRIQEAVKGADWQAALESIARAEELDPNLTKYNDIATEGERRLDEQDWEIARTEMANALAENNFEEARAALEFYLEENPEGVFTAPARAGLDEVDTSRKRWIWETTQADAAKFEKDGDLARAFSTYDAFFRNEPGHEAAPLARERACNLESRLQAEHAQKLWMSAEESARASASKDKYKGAVQLLAAFIRDNPESTYLAAARNKIAEYESKGRSALSERLLEADKLTRIGRLREAMIVVTRAEGVWKDEKSLSARNQAIRNKLQEASEAKLNALEAERDGSLPHAVVAMEKASRLDVENTEYAGLLQKYRTLMEQEQARAKIRRQRLIIMAYSIMACALLLITYRLVNRVRWQHELRAAVIARDLPHAATAAGHLQKKDAAAEFVQRLTTFIDLEIRITTQLHAMELVLSRYMPEQRATLQDTLKRVAKESDPTTGYKLLKEAEDKLMAATQPLRDLQEAITRAQAAIHQLDIYQVSHFLPSADEEIRAEEKRLAALADPTHAATGYAALAARADGLTNQIVQLNQNLSTAQSLLKQLDPQLEAIGAHAMVAHGSNELARLTQRAATIQNSISNFTNLEDVASYAQISLSLATTLAEKLDAALLAYRVAEAVRNRGIDYQAARWLGTAWVRQEDAWRGLKAQPSPTEAKRRYEQFAETATPLVEQARVLTQEAEALADLDQKASGLLARIRSNPLAAHAADDLAAIRKAYESNKGRDITPSEFATARTSLDTCSERAAQLLTDLRKAAGLNALLNQIQLQLLPMEKDLQTYLPDELAAYEKAADHLMKTTDLATFMSELKRTQSLAIDLVDQVDLAKRTKGIPQ